MRRMRYMGIPTIVALAIIVATATSRSQSADSTASTSTTSTPEPITGSASTPLTGSELPAKDPFQPYSIGDSASAWDYQSLNADEKKVVDHGAAEDFTAVNNAYAAASKALSDSAKADAATSQLGADNLETTGVVP